MRSDTFGISGLTDQQVLTSRQQHGKNELTYKKKNRFVETLFKVISEPMVLLLLLSSSIYFISGEPDDGIFLVAAVILIAAISLYQSSRTRNALVKLQDLTQPICKVVRNGKIELVHSDQLVIGDSIMVEEGTAIAADAFIIRSHDFSVNESVLTGESLPVFKDPEKDDPRIYSGTIVVSGLAVATVTAIGNQTALGKIGKSLEKIKEEKTPLELQINSFVNKIAVAGIVVFIVVWVLNFLKTYNLIVDLLPCRSSIISNGPYRLPWSKGCIPKSSMDD